MGGVILYHKLDYNLQPFVNDIFYNTFYYNSICRIKIFNCKNMTDIYNI
jgi:hypothetical protein